MLCLYFQCDLHLILIISPSVLFFQKPGFKVGRKHSYLEEANLCYSNLNNLQYESTMKHVKAPN